MEVHQQMILEEKNRMQVKVEEKKKYFLLFIVIDFSIEY